MFISKELYIISYLKCCFLETVTFTYDSAVNKFEFF